MAQMTSPEFMEWAIPYIAARPIKFRDLRGPPPGEEEVRGAPKTDPN
jgi:hypothetical protein